MGFDAHEQTKVVRGAMLTVLGGLALALYQSSDFILSGVFGLAHFGLYAVAASAIELSLHLIVGGFVDAITYFAAKPLYSGTGTTAGDLDEQRQRQLYRTLATSIAAPFLLALALAVVMQWATPWIYQLFWRDHDPLVITLLTTAAWSMPALVLVVLPTEALKSRLEVKWSVIIVQVVLPYLGGALAVAIHLCTDVGILAMSIAVLVAALVCIFPAFWAYSRVFSVRRTMRAIVSEPWDREVLHFALPQSLNMALNLGMVRVDTLVLSGVCDARTLGLYTLVVRITQLIRLAKMAFSGLFGPLVAKLNASGERQAIGLALGRFAGFSGSLGLAAAVVVMAVYPDLVLDTHEQVWTQSRLFPWLLAIGPLMSCFFGFAGNLLLMTGHARLLLFNSLIAVGLNLGLNLWLGVRYGIVGAAWATAIASVFISLLQLFQMFRLEGHPMPWRTHARTLAAGAVPLAMVATLHSGLVEWRLPGPPIVTHAAAAALSLLVYVALQLALPGPTGLRFRIKS